MDLKGLIRKRGGIKHSLTLFKGNVQNHEDSGEAGNNALSITELDERVKRIEGVFNEFWVCQTNIEEICDEENIQAQYKEREDFETRYIAAVAKAKHIINGFNKLEIENKEKRRASTDGVGVAGTTNNSASSVTGSNNVRLPIIQLPKFSGFYENWLEFRDTFNSIIHINRDIPDIQKLHYLRSSLQGQAAQVIRSLEISESNYEVAWKLLCDRFDNKKLLINNHVKALHSLPGVRQESAQDLRKLVDEFSKHLLSLEALGQPVQHWGTLLIYMITTKLDNQTKREWETSRLNEDAMPSIEDLTLFLKSRCELLETLENHVNKKSYTNNKIIFKPIESTTTLLASTTEGIRVLCVFCNNNDHLIYNCDSFLKLNAHERTTEVKGKRLCINCLKKNHFSTECRGRRCRKCNRKHHTLLHYEITTNPIINQGATTSRSIDQGEGGQGIVVANCSTAKGNLVLLSTANINVKDIRGNYVQCRALLDCGSESSFVATELCNKLGLLKSEINLSVIGINQISSNIKYRTAIRFNSCRSSYNHKIPCYVIDKITENLPLKTIEKTSLVIQRHIKLADDNFNQSGKIEILLGANVFWDLVGPGRIKLGNNRPILQETTLGWILGGPLATNQPETRGGIVCNLTRHIDVQDQLKRFWELEEVQGKCILSADDKLCENYFTATLNKNSDGRFIVAIPFKTPLPGVLGNSLETARKRFLYLERKLNKNSELRRQYVDFMKEYQMLGHMIKIPNPNSRLSDVYYLPYHGVLKENNLTTKLRVVFDGS